jgi:hypothetical protein
MTPRACVVSVVTVMFLTACADASAATAPRTPSFVASCLTGNSVMTNGPTNRKVVAPKSAQQAALGFSFALVSGQELNRGSLAFEKNAAAAKRVGNEYLTYQLARYKKGGIRVTPAMVKTTYFVKNNVVVLWDTEPGSIPAGRARAQRTLSTCL